MMTRIVLAFLTIAGCLSSGAGQQNPLPGFITDSLDIYVERGLKKWQLPGLAVGIVSRGKVVLLKGYGTTRVNGTEKVDENTLFMIGSNTKAFTGTLLAQLEASGKISMQDKIGKWLPEFRLYDTLVNAEVNFEDVLSHRIGFGTFQGDFTYWKSDLTREQIVQKMALVHPKYGFRTQWGYCNAGYVVAGQAIPKILGRSWEDGIRDSILIPLRMDRTLMLSAAFDKAPNRAFAHTLIHGKTEEIPTPNIDNLAPAGSMSSNVTDMVKWLVARLNNGIVDGDRAISETALDRIRRPASIVRVNPSNDTPDHFLLYGLGLMIGERNGMMEYSHTGGVDGFVSAVLTVPKEGLGIVVLTNSDKNEFFQDLAFEIRDAFLGLPYKGYSDDSFHWFKENENRRAAQLDSLKTIISKKNTPPVSLGKFTGSYRNPLYGMIRIIEGPSGLEIRFENHPHLIGRLQYIDNGEFLCTYSSPVYGIEKLPFKIDKDKVMGLTLSVDPFIEYTGYEFEKTD